MKNFEKKIRIFFENWTDILDQSESGVSKGRETSSGFGRKFNPPFPGGWRIPLIIRGSFTFFFFGNIN